MSRYRPSSRTVLGALALTATLPAVLVGGPGSVRARADSIVATGLELVTVTDRSVVVTWTTLAPGIGGRLAPAAANTELRIGPVDSTRAPVVAYVDEVPTPFHYAEVSGLEPGRSYRFEAWSNGVRARPARNVTTRRPGAPESTGVCTTLMPPPGRLLRTLALANDLHYGEPVSGLVVGELPRGVQQEPGYPPYPEVMLTALLHDLRRTDRDADHLVVAGDLTNEATPDEARGVRELLDGWGEPDRDYFACRGNHDRPHIGPHHEAGPRLPGLPHHDSWGANFTARQELRENAVGELRIIGLDTTELDGNGGVIERPQFARLRELLMAEPDRPTLVFGHHPVTRDSAFTNFGGPGFVLNPRDAAELQRLYRHAPGVFLHQSGHTHRNRRSAADLAIDVEFLEVAAVKEYPGGYSLLRLYEGGYMVNFYKTRSEAARRWSTRTRSQFFGLLPSYALGSTADRNHVVLRDLSGLLPASPRFPAGSIRTAVAFE